MGFHHVELMGNRLRRRRSKWLTCLVPLLAAAALLAIACTIIVAVLLAAGR